MPRGGEGVYPWNPLTRLHSHSPVLLLPPHLNLLTLKMNFRLSPSYGLLLQTLSNHCLSGIVLHPLYMAGSKTKVALALRNRTISILVWMEARG